MKKYVIGLIFSILLAVNGFTQVRNASTTSSSSIQLSNKSYPTLKAVLIVGPQEDGTSSAIEEMNEIAELFISNGVKIEKFYDDQTDWEKIKIASKNASFFVYSGHGSKMGEGGKTGGLCLKSMVLSKEIVEELKLRKNAIVIFKSVCRGAGSSASDNRDIGIDEALARVTDYSKPFFDIGASCYFANNFKNGCVRFLNELFSGRSFQNCFFESTKNMKITTWIDGIEKIEHEASIDTKIEISKEYRYDNNKQISIVSNNMGGVSTRTTYANGIKKSGTGTIIKRV